MGKKKKKQMGLSNKAIVIMKIICACFLLLVCGLFLFSQTRIDNGEGGLRVVMMTYILWQDITSWNLMPILFFLAVLAICAYISFLVFRITYKNLYFADKFDILYKVVFSFVLLYICIRSLFVEPYLNVPLEIVVLALVSGLFNWLTPATVFNDSEEF